MDLKLQSAPDGQLRAKLIFLTIYEEPDFLDVAFSAGASGYVTKARLSIDLIPPLHEVLWGTPLHPDRYRTRGHTT